MALLISMVRLPANGRIRRIAVSLVAALILPFSSLAQAGLIVNIDTSNQEFYLTGSDDVVGNPTGFVVWRFSSALSTTTENTPAANSLASLSTGSYDGDGVHLDFFTAGWFFVFSTTNNSTAFTINGTGAAGAASYAGWGALNAAAFEAAIGSSTSLPYTGSGGTLSYRGVQLPEPSTLSLLVAGLFGLGFFRRKRAA